ncbi:MAG: hypothetical protein J5494_07785 [Candidatus Methanomethylophilaceae archaeon]|nr:hypothetical protein [Candidatus Methanomethylophilaceae archaeon]
MNLTGLSEETASVIFMNSLSSPFRTVTYGAAITSNPMPWASFTESRRRLVVRKNPILIILSGGEFPQGL